MSEAPDHPMIVKLQKDGYAEVPEPIYDIYDTELCEEDALRGHVLQNEHGELIHKDNLIEFVVEYCGCKIVNSLIVGSD